MPNLEDTLRPQFRAILQQYTKSVRIDEMVNDLLEAVKRDAPRVEIPVPIEACNHMSRLMRQPDGSKRLECKHCKKIFPI